jgi:hypothetical protein
MTTSKVVKSTAKPPNAGKGRKKGVPNKSTAQVKAAFEAAFEGLGGVPTLIAWAKENQTDFFKLYAKLLPVQMNHSGVDGLAKLLDALPD